MICDSGSHVWRLAVAHLLGSEASRATVGHVLTVLSLHRHSVAWRAESLKLVNVMNHVERVTSLSGGVHTVSRC